MERRVRERGGVDKRCVRVRSGSYATAVVLALCWLALSGCEQDPRLPYVPASLANWPQPYRGVSGLKLHVFVTGHVRLSEALILRGGRLTTRRDFPIAAMLIEHPTQGLILFNTGLHQSRAEAASSGATWLSMLLSTEVLPGQGIKTQLMEAGFKPEAVRWIVLSTLRAEQTGEVESFPNARVVVAKAEHAYAQQAPPGYTPAEFDDVANWKFIDFTGTAPLATFPAHVDLFADDSCILLDVSGSTPGTMALLVRLPTRPLLLAGDLAAVRESVRYAARPAAAYDLTQWWDHIWRLKKFMDLVPELLVLPGADIGGLDAVHSKEIVVHPFAPPQDAVATPTPGLLRRLLPPT